MLEDNRIIKNNSDKTPPTKMDIRDAHDYAQDAASRIKLNSDSKQHLKNTFPSNSLKGREQEKQKTETKKVEKIVKGKVVTRKKSWGKRAMESVVGDDVDSVGSYILHDVLIPAFKSTISDMVQGGIEMLLFGERKSSRTKRDGGKSYVSYNSYSSGHRRDDRDRDKRDISARGRSRHNFDEIILATRGEAEEVIDHLVDLTIDYDAASVSDLYDLVGISGNFTDDKWGWTDLSSASTTRVRDGYRLNLPKTRLLD